jgi:hypothetical protein
LIQEDGTRVTVDSGPLEGVKVTDDGRVSTDVWQRLSRLESQYERVLRGQEELMGQLSPVRFRVSPFLSFHLVFSLPSRPLFQPQIFPHESR